MVNMPARKKFELIYAPVVKRHLRAIEAKHHSLIREQIESQLQFEPDVETRNRKPLKRTPSLRARWEIRFGSKNRFRVFYLVNRDSMRVEVLAIGEKDGARLLIEGKEVEL